MNNSLPSSVEEAFETFTKPNDDAPRDCHTHCDHYWRENERCCDCGEEPGVRDRTPVGVEELISKQAETHPVALTYGGLSWDYDAI